ncbi:MAG: hypothetical protein ACXAD7_15820 [Candidatus Kariarchaeaceae archaeon]
MGVKVDPSDDDTNDYGEMIQHYFAKIENDIQKEIEQDRVRDQGIA